MAKPFNFQTETMPGKDRNPFLEQQMHQIENALNGLPNFVISEAPTAVASGTNNVYTLAQVPLRGTVAMYDAGKRIAPSSFTVLGRVVTIATASIAGPTLFDYYY